jgi:uncharacterized coiled-coil protein SlyX
VFEKDLDHLAVFLERPHPEFFGGQVHDQPGGELQWVIIADMRGKVEPPASQRIQFSVRESNWMDGLARAMQEALARLCGQHVNQIKGTRFYHYVRHDSMGDPMDLPPHPELKYHVEHLDFMLHETRKELDNSRAHINSTHLEHIKMKDTIAILAKDRKTLRHQRAKKDYTIARLRVRVASLEQTVKDQETQLKDLEKEGEDIQGDDTALLSDDADFEEDADTEEEDYEFLEAGEDDFIAMDDEEEEPMEPGEEQ